MIVLAGWEVEYKGKEYTVLGYAEGVDEQGARLLELGPTDATTSTEPLAVPRKDIKVTDYKFKNVKPPGIW